MSYMYSIATCAFDAAKRIVSDSGLRYVLNATCTQTQDRISAAHHRAPRWPLIVHIVLTEEAPDFSRCVDVVLRACISPSAPLHV